MFAGIQETSRVDDGPGSKKDSLTLLLPFRSNTTVLFDFLFFGLSELLKDIVGLLGPVLIGEVIASHHDILDYLLLQIRIGQPRIVPQESHLFVLFLDASLFLLVCLLLICGAIRRLKPIH